MSDKTASLGLLSRLLSMQVLRILDGMTANATLELCDCARQSLEYLHDEAVHALQSLTDRVGVARANADPVWSQLCGKPDSSYMQNVAVAWLMGESLLCWLNPQYRPVFRTNRVYARMAVWRTLLGEADRRVVMVTNRRVIEHNPSMRQCCLSGLSVEQMENL